MLRLEARRHKGWMIGRGAHVQVHLTLHSLHTVHLSGRKAMIAAMLMRRPRPRQPGLVCTMCGPCRVFKGAVGLRSLPKPTLYRRICVGVLERLYQPPAPLPCASCVFNDLRDVHYVQILDSNEDNETTGMS
jgi:hypothetical protein